MYAERKLLRLSCYWVCAVNSEDEGNILSFILFSN